MTSYGEKRCQECNHPVAPELDEKITVGNTVYCEQCGASLTETTVIKSKSRRNSGVQPEKKNNKNLPYSGARVRTKRGNPERERNRNKETKNSSSWQSTETSQNTSKSKDSWTGWIAKFREFLQKFIKNLKESLGNFSTSLRDEMSKVREEIQGSAQKNASNSYPDPIMPKEVGNTPLSQIPSRAPIAPKAPIAVIKTPHLKGSEHARFDPYTGKPLVKKTPKVVLGKKFDPFTGKPMNQPHQDLQPRVKSTEKLTDKEKPIVVYPKSSNNEKIHSQISIPDEKSAKSEIKPSKTYAKVFTVLTREVRELLSDLEIPENEKISVAKTFIYLSENQQIKYLKELQSLNSPDYTQLNHLIKTIDALPLPSDQKKILINQLDYFTDEKSHEFVDVIQKEVRKDIERLKSNKEPVDEILVLNPDENIVEEQKEDKTRKKLLSD